MYIDHNLLFSGDYISALRGCCPLKFLHELEIDQGLLAHTPKGDDGPPPQKKNADLISISLCAYNIMQELATCSQSQRTVQSMVSSH